MNHTNQNSDYVLWWWQRGEFAEQRGDWQATSCFELPGADLLQDASSEEALQSTPLGEPQVDFSVRSVYDSRPINGYDFNFSANTIQPAGGGIATFNFQVPLGYRAVPREWDILVTQPTTLSSADENTITFTQNNAAVPNNNPIVFGTGGTDRPIKTFFVCEEQTPFGAVVNLGATTAGFNGTVFCQVYGNLIPVSAVALPFAIANENK
jgi:hypothetical protein